MRHKIYKKIALVILDGFGIAPPVAGNAIAQAKTPTFDYLASNFPSLTLQASGPLVGLPWGEMGNSEVGHLNMGAGRIIGQSLPKITMAIQSGEFFKVSAFLEAADHAKKNNSALHLIGMVSSGGVHSWDEHLYALLGLSAELRLNKVFIHMFTDGRDTEPKVALEAIKKLNERIARLGVGKVATLAGRFYGMDRGGHWGQIIQTYKAMVEGLGLVARSPEEAVNNCYNQQIFDEMVPPTVIVEPSGQPVAKILDNDALIFFNFRPDRAIQLTKAFVAPDSLPAEYKQKVPANLFVATMTEYDPTLPVKVAFPREDLKNNLAEVLSNRGLTQFHTAESEKYAHVTSFFNCGRTEKLPGEEQVIIKSPTDNASNYSDHPEMSTPLLTETLVPKIMEGKTNFFVVNFANCDMVGHTGSLAAGIKAVEAVDACLKKILDACLAADTLLIVTADHGNIEQLINPKTGDIDKDHTTNPIPFLLASNEFKFIKPFNRQLLFLASRLPAGAISDIAPTILALFGIEKPTEMSGINLLDEIDEIPEHK